MPKAAITPTTPTIARKRHVRAASGALDRKQGRTPGAVFLEGTGGRCPQVQVTLYPTEDDGLPYASHAVAPVLFNWTGPVTVEMRQRIERDVHLLVELLNALDGDPDLDGGRGDEDCCEGGDDDPASSQIHLPGFGTVWGPADPADAEEDDPAECNGDLEQSGDECEPSDAHDHNGDRLHIVHGGVPL